MRKGISGSSLPTSRRDARNRVRIASDLLHSIRRFFGKVPDDLRHFILQLGFVSDWWPGSPLTFNGPIWSVSIEILLYLLFFVAAKSLVLRIETVAAVSIAGFLLLVVDDDLGRGISMFYIGGLACYRVEEIAERNVSQRLVATIIIVAVAAFVILKGTGARGYAGWFLMVVAFPGLIVILASLEWHSALRAPFAMARQYFVFDLSTPFPDLPYDHSAGLGGRCLFTPVLLCSHIDGDRTIAGIVSLV